MASQGRSRSQVRAWCRCWVRCCPGIAGTEPGNDGLGVGFGVGVGGTAVSPVSKGRFRWTARGADMTKAPTARAVGAFRKGWTVWGLQVVVDQVRQPSSQPVFLFGCHGLETDPMRARQK